MEHCPNTVYMINSFLLCTNITGDLDHALINQLLAALVNVHMVIIVLYVDASLFSDPILFLINFTMSLT